MTRSEKLGVASVLLLGGSVTPLPPPFGAVFLMISCVLALLAARDGSRWWLLVPGSIMAAVTFLLYLGFHGLYA